MGVTRKERLLKAVLEANTEASCGGVTREERLLKAMLEDNAEACCGGVTREERILGSVAKKVCENDALEGGGGGSGDLAKQIIERTATEISDSTITNVGNQVFRNFSGLKAVDFPACTNIGDGAFIQCTSLETASFPACTNIGVGAFSSCTNLRTANFPACTTVGASAFISCTNLGIAYFPNLSSIYGNAFRNCTSLSALILAGSSVCSAPAAQILTGTAIESGSGYIYVKRSLVDAYQAAQGWSYVKRFSAIEDSEFA